MRKEKKNKGKIWKLLQKGGVLGLAFLLVLSAPVSVMAEETIGEMVEETIESELTVPENVEPETEEAEPEGFDAENPGEEGLEGETPGEEGLEGETSEEGSLEGETPEEEAPEIDDSHWIEQELLLMETDGEFTIMFYYEGEQPEIIFLSPSGKRYGEKISTEDEFLFAHGDGWSTYKVLNAEAGQWNVRCDKKNNDEIEYTFVDVVSGICVQSFSLAGIEGTTATVQFEVTKGEEETWYQYTVSAVAKGAQNVKHELASGTASTMQPQEILVQMNISDREEYYLLLEVIHNDDIETFDSMEIGPFAYDNPNTAAAIENFLVDVNLKSGLCKVDWTSYKSNHWNVSYKLEVIADGAAEEPVYSITTDETSALFYYPTATETMEITLSMITDGLLSEPKKKVLDFKNGEYVKVLTEEVTGEATLELEFLTKNATELYVILNEKSGVYAVDGAGQLPFTLGNGWNTVEAYFTGDDRITYRTEKEVYYTWLTPEITLYEELDGKMLRSETVRIAGNVKNASTLTINDTEVQTDEKGEFSYEMNLTEGENVITIAATTETGIGAVRTLTVTKTAETVAKGTNPAKAEDAKGLPELKWANLFPIIGIALAGLVLVLGFFLCSAKKKKGVAIALAALFAVVAGAAGYLYFRLHEFNNSVDYIKLAKSSTQTAANYLDYEKYAKLTAIGAGGAFVLTLIGIIVVCIVKGRKAKKEKTEE